MQLKLVAKGDTCLERRDEARRAVLREEPRSTVRSRADVTRAAPRDDVLAEATVADGAGRGLGVVQPIAPCYYRITTRMHVQSELY